MKRKFLYVFLALLIGLQFYRPDITPSTSADGGSDLFTAYPGAPSEIKEACYDCHSHESELPWYGQVNPVGIFVRNHIIEGREHLNFSLIGQLDPRERAEILKECSEEIRKEKMPMKAYTWIHPHARFSSADREALAAWFDRTASAR